MRTRKIVNKLRSKGYDAKAILVALDAAYNSASEKDKAWWNQSKIKKSLIQQSI